jgi:hypothetical protein
LLSNTWIFNFKPTSVWLTAVLSCHFLWFMLDSNSFVKLLKLARAVIISWKVYRDALNHNFEKTV